MFKRLSLRLNIEQQTALGGLVIELAHVMPSAAAIEHASMEWRNLRRGWLAALEILGMSEEEARELAAEHVKIGCYGALGSPPRGGA